MITSSIIFLYTTSTSLKTLCMNKTVSIYFIALWYFEFENEYLKKAVKKYTQTFSSYTRIKEVKKMSIKIAALFVRILVRAYMSLVLAFTQSYT